jgi:hypothetical protein
MNKNRAVQTFSGVPLNEAEKFQRIINIFVFK